MNWPKGAMCYKNGQFYDSHNRVVRSNDTLDTVANDNAIGDALAERIVSQLVGTRIRRNAAMDMEAEATVAELLPALRAAVARDNAEEEQAVLDGEVEEQHALDSNEEARDFYQQEKARWNKIHEANKGNRGRGYAPVSAVAKKGR